MPRVIVPIVLGLFALLGISLLFGHSFPLAREETDGVVALSRALGTWFYVDAFHGPGLPWALRPLVALGLEAYRAAQLLSLLSALALLALAFHGFRELLPPWERLLSLILLGLHPTLLTLESSAESDLLATSFCFASLFLVIRSKTARGVTLAGILFGAAWLVRYQALALLPAAILALSLDERRGRGARALGILVFFGVALLVVAPWHLYLWRETGDPILNWNHLNIAFALGDRAGGWSRFPSIQDSPSLLSLVLADPLRLLTHLLRNLARAPALLLDHSLPLGLLVLLGLVRTLRAFSGASSRSRRQALSLVLYALAHLSLVSLSWLEPRFLLPLLPMVLALGAAGWFWIAHALWRLIKARGLLLAWVALGLWVAVSEGSRGARAVAEQREKVPLEYQQAAILLRAAARPGDQVLSSKPHIPVFAVMEWHNLKEIALESTDPERFVMKARGTGAQWLVWDERYAAREYPWLAGLGDADTLSQAGLLRESLRIEGAEPVIIVRLPRVQGTEGAADP